MAEIGPVEFTSATNASTGDDQWGSITNVLTGTGTRATSTGKDAEVSYIAKITNAATALAAIGDTDPVTGIEFEVMRGAEDDEIYNNLVRLYVAGSLSGTAKTSTNSGAWEYGSPPETVTFGGPGDVWGLSSPTGATVKNTGFGIGIQALLDGRSDTDAYLY